jgi:hypothetical protein
LITENVVLIAEKDASIAAQDTNVRRVGKRTRRRASLFFWSFPQLTPESEGQAFMNLLP